MEPGTPEQQLLAALLNFMTPSVQPDGQTLLSWQLRGSDLYRDVELALLSFREPFKRIHQHMNWGRIEYDLWHGRVGKFLGLVTWRNFWNLPLLLRAPGAADVRERGQHQKRGSAAEAAAEPRLFSSAA